MKQREILERVRARGTRGDSGESVGGVTAQIVPAGFIPVEPKIVDWASRIQSERDAARAAARAELAKGTPEGSSEADTQPDQGNESAGKAKRGARKPRTTLARGRASS